MGLPIIWTKHLPREKREEFEKTLRNSTLILSRLEDIISEMENSLKLGKPDFNEASWSYHHAYNLGELAGLRKIKELLTFVHKG